MTGRGGPSSSTTSAPGSGGEVPRTRDCPSDSLRSLSNRGNHLSVRVSDPLMRGYRFLWELYPNGHDLSLGRRGRRAPVLLRALRPFWTDLRLLEDNAGSGRLSSGLSVRPSPVSAASTFRAGSSRGQYSRPVSTQGHDALPELWESQRHHARAMPPMRRPVRLGAL